MNLVDRALTMMLKRGGVECTATISGVATTFYGVFNVTTLLESDNVGQILIEDPSLMVLTSVANTLKNGDVVTLNSTGYRVTDKKLIEDGTLTTMTLMKVTA